MTAQDRTLAHVVGADVPPLLDQTIGATVAAAARAHGGREALVSIHQNIRLSYAQLDAETTNLACGLLSLGLRPGDRVGIWAPNCAEWALAQFATAKAGLILVTINPAYRLFELDYALNKVECRALILADSFKSSHYFEMIAGLAPELSFCAPGQLKSAKLPHLEMVIGFGADVPPGFIDFGALSAPADQAARAALAQVAADLAPRDAINIQFTSGTTGAPKGATLSHRNILNNGYFVGEAIRLTQEDRMAIPVPLYHCFGMVMGNLGCLTHGAAMIYPGPAFDPSATLKAVQQERCSVLYGVPTMFIAELAAPDFADYDLTSLRTGIMAGAPCPVEVMKKIMSDMHMPEVTIAYGMTETSPVSFQSSTDETIERRVSTIGRVQPHLEVKIVDESGNTCPRGAVGELCTKGYAVMSGYWNDEARTRDCLIDGWMHTGDLATIDDEGYGNIVGRLKDMVIRGGENIYPREIEEFLYTHPQIAEVAVFGVPDLTYGEALCAWIQKRAAASLTEEDVRAFCKGQIAHFKIPKYIRFVDAFPMTVTGKIQKFEMRDAMTAELGLSVQRTA